MSRGLVGDAAAAVFFVALLYLLVRPRSKAAEAVDAVGKTLVALVRRATEL